MAKDMAVALLLDFYGALLTEKQFDMVDLYYNDDFSLSEIAENNGITRQGVRAAIKKGEGILIEAEEKLGLAARFAKLVEKAQSAGIEVEGLIAVNDVELGREDIGRALESIRDDLKYILDNA